MKLYHGTNHKSFDKILLSKSKDNKDFGKGFYLTDDKQQALELDEYEQQRNNIHDKLYQ